MERLRLLVVIFALPKFIERRHPVVLCPPGEIRHIPIRILQRKDKGIKFFLRIGKLCGGNPFAQGKQFVGRVGYFPAVCLKKIIIIRNPADPGRPGKLIILSAFAVPHVVVGLVIVEHFLLYRDVFPGNHRVIDVGEIGEFIFIMHAEKIHAARFAHQIEIAVPLKIEIHGIVARPRGQVRPDQRFLAGSVDIDFHALMVLFVFLRQRVQKRLPVSRFIQLYFQRIFVVGRPFGTSPRGYGKHCRQHQPDHNPARFFHNFLLFYPFKPPATVFCMIVFWNTPNTANTGSIDSISPAK